MLSFIFFTVACALACNADPIAPLQGSFNKYFIYSRQFSRDPVELDATNIWASADVLSLENNTTIIVHGHKGSGTTTLNPILKDAALESEDMNVIVVDWSVYASQSYNNAVGAVSIVGTALAQVIQELVRQSAVTLDTLHLIGFDLGAHVVGFTGRALDGEVARITGLNPSGREWGTHSPRLNSNDALYVEVIHTDAVGLLAYGVGDAIGDVNFYPNGGTGQPGCFLNNYCSHNRAWELMAASLTHNLLIGNKCGNWPQVKLNTCSGYLLRMGNNDHIKLGSGMFRVNTRTKYPFA
ncbi:lipase member H-B-like [Maniola jurtina]|uniref:lipase member H-B-like n=1 Tax=Maniola jurtina TaxID=191418 RepID=UPI001E6874C3|nr:lipase member H-B-like [Maniola jurtina]